MFDIGDRVVCVNARFDSASRSLYTALPVEGREYVIRDVRLGICPDSKTGAVSVLLDGVVNQCAHSKAALERGFHADRFRKLAE